MFLVMGFTGRAAAQMKETLIAAFNAMADHIRAGALNAVQEFSRLNFQPRDYVGMRGASPENLARIRQRNGRKERRE